MHAPLLRLTLDIPMPACTTQEEALGAKTDAEAGAEPQTGDAAAMDTTQTWVSRWGELLGRGANVLGYD